MRRGLRTLVALAALAAGVLGTARAEALPLRVAILGPDDAPIVGRIVRNVKALHVEAVAMPVSACSRESVAQALASVEATAAFCADPDQIAIWRIEGDRIVLKDVILVGGSDDRAQEIAVARATTELRDGDRRAAGSGPGSNLVLGGISKSKLSSSSSSADKGVMLPPPPPLERITPPIVLGIGPGVVSGRDGTSFAISAEAEIGLGRYVALVPWLDFPPVNRDVGRAEGTASFRPTLFGLGIGIPLAPAAARVVPRIGAGYAMLWLHVSPESANAPAVTKPPEDLLAPAIYISTAVSVKVAPTFRVALSGFAGAASNTLVIRIANQQAGAWGPLFTGLDLRGEWVP